MKHYDPDNFTSSLHKNHDIIKERLHQTTELTIRTIQIGESKPYIVSLLYLNNIANGDMVRDFLITPLFLFKEKKKTDIGPFIEFLAARHIRASSVETSSSIEKSLNGIVNGKTLVLVDGFEQGILAETSEWQQRSVEQSSRQRSPGGPMIGLSEQLDTNLNLIRSYVRTPDLVVESKQIGRFAKTNLAIVYIKKKVDQVALEEVRKRIELLDVEYVLESRVVEDALEGRKKTIFPLVYNTEMPDLVASALYEGRIAVIVNGTPNASLVPCLFVQYLEEPNEYYSKTGRLSNRLVLAFCYFLASCLPGIYLAIRNFHQNWFPKKFAEAYFSESNTILPFFLEVTLLLFILYVLSLVSFRIPVDMIIVASLVGTTVIGSTAIEAKLIHPLSLIIVGISFLTNLLFLTGGMSSASLTLRFVFLITGNFLGLIGIGIALVILVFYMSKLRSVGVPYLAPIIPFRPQEFKDVFYRGNLKKLINSPHKFPHDDNE